MPVYKVEDYVAKAIESVLGQTLRDIELIAVDDGTPDRSGQICDAYASKDDRMQVIHKENGGAPSARNVAIDIAKGKYMMFMDSDDWIEPDMLEKMYNLAERDKAQLVISGFYIDTYYEPGKYITEPYCVDSAAYTQEEFRRQAYRYFDRNQFYSPWNKLFESKYLQDNNLKFPLTFWDDFPFVLSVIRDVERVTFTDECFYHFIRAREESETTAYKAGMYEKREEEHGWMLDLYSYWGIHDAASREMIARRYVERFIGCLENLTNPNSGKSKGEIKREIKQMLANPNLREQLPLMQARSNYMKCMILPLKWKHVTLAYLEAKVVTNVKTKHKKTFARLKAGR